MLPTKQRLIETYKNFPEYRTLLDSLYGQLLSSEDLLLLNQNETILKLKKELEDCKK